MSLFFDLFVQLVSDFRLQLSRLKWHRDSPRWLGIFAYDNMMHYTFLLAWVVSWKQLQYPSLRQVFQVPLSGNMAHGCTKEELWKAKGTIPVMTYDMTFREKGIQTTVQTLYQRLVRGVGDLLPLRSLKRWRKPEEIGNTWKYHHWNHQMFHQMFPRLHQPIWSEYPNGAMDLEMMKLDCLRQSQWKRLLQHCHSGPYTLCIFVHQLCYFWTERIWDIRLVCRDYYATHMSPMPAMEVEIQLNVIVMVLICSVTCHIWYQNRKAFDCWTRVVGPWSVDAAGWLWFMAVVVVVSGPCFRVFCCCDCCSCRHWVNNCWIDLGQSIYAKFPSQPKSAPKAADAEAASSSDKPQTCPRACTGGKDAECLGFCVSNEFNSHRIHGTGIFTYIWLIFMVYVYINIRP